MSAEYICEMVRAMIATGHVKAERQDGGAEAAPDTGPLYLRIREVLANAIAAGRLSMRSCAIKHAAMQGKPRLLGHAASG